MGHQVKVKAERGDVRATDALLILTFDAEFDVRLSAVESLAFVSPPDDMRVIVPLIRRLQDRSWEMRSTAAETLGRVATRGNRVVSEALNQHLHNEVFRTDTCTEFSAIRALDSISVKGDDRYVRFFLEYLSVRPDNMGAVAALQSLARIARTDDHEVHAA